MATWLPALLTAVLTWLTSFVVAQSRKTGEDAPRNAPLANSLNRELDAWKRENGVPQ
jgi:hypothetical protein